MGWNTRPIMYHFSIKLQKLSSSEIAIFIHAYIGKKYTTIILHDPQILLIRQVNSIVSLYPSMKGIL